MSKKKKRKIRFIERFICCVWFCASNINAMQRQTEARTCVKCDTANTVKFQFKVQLLAAKNTEYQSIQIQEVLDVLLLLNTNFSKCYQRSFQEVP